MSDLDKGFSHYWILKCEWDEMNKSARQLGHSDHEIRELHRMAHEIATDTGGSHPAAFEVLLRVVSAKSPDTLRFHEPRRTTMWENIRWRFNQWLTRWQYRQHKKYKNLEPSDD